MIIMFEPGTPVQVCDSLGEWRPGVYKAFVGLYAGQYQAGALHRVKMDAGPLVCVYAPHIRPAGDAGFDASGPNVLQQISDTEDATSADLTPTPDAPPATSSDTAPANAPATSAASASAAPGDTVTMPAVA